MDYNNPSFREKDQGVNFIDIALKETGDNKSAAATEDSTLSGRRGNGLFLSWRQIGIAIGVIVLVVLVIALAAGVNHHMTEDIVAGASLSNTSPDNPNLPWNNVNLPSHLEPLSYSVELSLDPSQTKFSGSVDITISCLQNTKFIVLHANKLTLYKDLVSIVQKESQQTMKIMQQFTQEKYHYYVIEVAGNLAIGKQYVLRFGKFNGDISRSSTEGLFVSSYANEKGGRYRYLLASNLHPIHARQVFPCFDEPSKRAVFNVVINHPPIYTNVLFSTHRVSRTATPGTSQWVKDTFESTPFLPPHVLAIFISDRSYINEALDVGGDRHNILLWSPSRYLSQTTLAQAAANASFNYYSTYLANYPAIDLSHHVAIPEYPSSVTSGWGLFFYSMDEVLADKQHPYSVSASKRAQVCLSVAGKIAQMFFGSLVTPDRWNDMWVADGVARVLAYDAVASIEPDLSMDHFIIAMDILPGLFLDSSPGSSHILSYQMQYPSDTALSSHPLSQYKGSSVISMTRAIMGAESFQDSLQKFVQRNKYQSTPVETLWSVMSREIMFLYNMSRVVRTWSLQTGYPLITLGEEFTHAHEMILVDQALFRLDEQTVPPTSPFDYIWDFQLNYGTDEAPGFRRHKWIENQETRFNFPSDQTFHWLIGNVDFEYFYRINLPLNDWESVYILLSRDKHALSPETRAMFIDSSFGLALTGRIEMATLLRYLRLLDKERSYLPWCAGMRAMNFLRDRLQNSALLGTFQRFIVDRIRVGVDFLGWSPKPRDTFQDRYLRMILLEAAVKNSASSPEIIVYANIAFTNWKDNPNSIQSDQQRAIFYEGISEGTVADWDMAWEEIKYTMKQDYRDALLYGLSATREPWVLRRYLYRCLNDTALTRAQGARSFMQVVQSDYGRNIALQFFKDNWSSLYQRFAATHTFPDLVDAVFDASGSHIEVNELQQLFSSLPQTSPLSLRVNAAVARATWNIQWINRNMNTLSNILAQQ
ncbi:aminopeptidase N-like [Amphiura filiformis]|uniref:aminopeptidase N-like n=1 Tax=Amphiura filiformis TaxID=82378 RepID=UPI003B227A8C